MKYFGVKYIWNNKMEGRERVFFKIDRILINIEWLNEFFGGEIIFLIEGLFDYIFVLICFMENGLILYKFF